MKKKYYDSETMILMHDGTIKKVQDIKKNNIVISVDGKGNIVKNVLNDTNEMYNIIPTRGESYTVAKNHTLILKASNYEMIWWQESRKRYRIRWLQNFSIKEKSYSVSTHGSRENAEEKAKKYLKKEVPKLDGYTKYRDIIEIEAKDYYKLSKRVRDVYKGFSVGIDFPEKEVSCDPYLIGMWLGDGDSDSNRITTADKEIVDYLNDYCQKNKLELKKVAKYRYHPSTGAYGGPGRMPFRNKIKK